MFKNDKVYGVGPSHQDSCKNISKKGLNAGNENHRKIAAKMVGKDIDFVDMPSKRDKNTDKRKLKNSSDMHGIKANIGGKGDSIKIASKVSRKTGER